MKLAVITGGARGIGRSIADVLDAEGYKLLLVDVSDAVDGAAAELGALAVRADISTREGVNAIVTAAEESGAEPALLVNNAGITRDSLLRKMDEAAFRAVVRINLGGTIALTEALAPKMCEGSAVVNISSRAQLGNVGQFNYGIAKAGLIGATRALALSLAPRTRVNAVAPGFTESEMTLAMPEQVRERIINSIPVGRAGKPVDIANAVAWLGSDRAGYINGQVLYACGGRTF
ncbi:SDR family oxidoreductase [Mycolicibacterium diernhoferi]|uniref:3-oxoacyl-ACP reductase n=1 Tax=Mycolicibacterium diernhoferi TaxID=1801 RepID=A0A1Q4HEB7_9MYCO|nr:SDR family oxidoreductase [Mycolicibacterium diernhoferi]OJZ65890.1 3-oxoacyl-ACP reductase [Mycolicibacterium diernhoferi]OPE50877.1 3-oxoacyl-ACP reductase [Mycolicibacterium diernhoferi]PEG53266.1 3-oxoacyl-ACP reductase [Mycolicibacterium diernhoferi]QYL23796.1 SDR family oxidoreductase [Mycolicibacterium diernhoferi]